MEIKKFPEERQVYYKNINKTDLYRMPYSGLYNKPMAHDPAQSYLAYIPESAHLSTPVVILIPDAAQEKQNFLENSGWVEAADSTGIVLIIPDGTIPECALDHLIEDILLRDHMVLNKNYLYLCGYGSGADKAQRLAMKNPVPVCGLALFGALHVSADELGEMDQVPSEEPGVPLSMVSMPVWLACQQPTQNEERVLAYWKRANRSQEKPFFQDGDMWYLPTEDINDSLINHVAGGKIRVSTCTQPPVPSKLWEYLSHYGRFAGIGNLNLRRIVTPEAAGMEFRTIEVDGVRREWYQYTPQRVKDTPEKKVPLVFSFHGGSNSHLRTIPMTEWVKVAEARGFIVVFPGSALRTFPPRQNWLPHSAWNAVANPESLDDEKFIRKLTEQLLSEGHVDRSRIYATGQSMGSAFGQRVLLAMPDLFAAAGLTSGVLRGGFFGDYNTPGIIEDHQRPIWVIMGGRDIGGGDYDVNPDTRKYAEYWTRRNHTQPVDRPLTYQKGAYLTKVYHNSKGVPMVQFSTVENKFHSATPEDSWMLYDEFLCKFSMDENGRTVYMNGIVMD